jgi:transposase
VERDNARVEKILHLISKFTSARTIQHAQILLKTDVGAYGPKWSDEHICEAFDVGASTCLRVRKRFTQCGIADALDRRPQPERPEKRKINGEHEARLIALSCGPAPEGHQRWSLRLLADRFVVLETGEHVSYETMRETLKKIDSSRGETSIGVFLVN